jgi:hypothetical protein
MGRYGIMRSRYDEGYHPHWYEVIKGVWIGNKLENNNWHFELDGIVRIIPANVMLKCYGANHMSDYTETPDWAMASIERVAKEFGEEIVDECR